MNWIEDLTKRLVAEMPEPYHIDDMKTPSGQIHVGSLRGVFIHDLVYKELVKQGKKVAYTYIYNDMDPMNKLPSYLDSRVYSGELGKPLFKIKAPGGGGAYSEYYGGIFTKTFNAMGAYPEILWSSKMYLSGRFNDVIRTALDKVDLIRKIYVEVANYNKPESWYPVQVICPKCGRVGTTLTTNWDGSQVSFECKHDLVPWAVGCGYTGKISPYDGNAKLMWKVDWPAHWKVLGVNVEGAGKDHTSAGGSRDMANRLCREVFDIPVPFDIPYEWFLAEGGKKMSTSKAVGMPAEELIQILPPELARFLILRTNYNTALIFEPVGETVPDLFDEFDRCFEKSKSPASDLDKDLGKYFLEAVWDDKYDGITYLPRFRNICTYIQLLNTDVNEWAKNQKGSALTQAEKTVLEERINYARKWLGKYAPDKYLFSFKSDMPAQVRELKVGQREFLQKLVNMFDEKYLDGFPAGDVVQTDIFELAKNSSVGSSKAFEAIYASLIGKPSGPKAGWLIADISLETVKRRFSQVCENSLFEPISPNNVPREVAEKIDCDTSNNIGRSREFCIGDDIKDKFPGMFYAYCYIENVDIKKTNPDLEKLKKEVVKTAEAMSSQDVDKLLPIAKYRELFKATGVDLHKCRPSPDALLKRLIAGKGIYNINTAVDAYNLAVIQVGVGLGGFDANKVSQPVELRLSRAGDSVHLLGEDAEEVVGEGRIVYSDQARILTVDLNYRDSDFTKITEKTKNILLFADGAPGLDKEQVIDALKLGAGYIQRLCGGKIGQTYLIL